MASAKYEVISQSVEDLFSSGSIVFKVPVFQRTYAWGREEIIQLIDDIFGESQKIDLPYFLGSIVLAEKEDAEEGPKVFNVLDGQQRMTTLSLIISVLIEKMAEEGSDDTKQERAYLYAKRKGRRQPKLQLQKKDSSLYESLIESPYSCYEKKNKNQRLSNTVLEIINNLEFYSENNKDYSVSGFPYQEMYDRLVNSVEIVRITAPSERDAFRLFETLNDRGLALSAADLIKNKLLSQCGHEIDDAVEAWTSMVSSVQEDDVVNYLRTYWISFKGFVRKRSLYDQYRDHIDTLSPINAAMFCFELDDVSKSYEHIVSPNVNKSIWGSDIAESLQRLNNYRAKSCRPFILAIAQRQEDMLSKAIDICESISVRFSIVGERNPNRLEMIYSDLCKEVRDNNKSLKDICRDPEYFSEVPSDEEFYHKLQEMEISSVTPAWRQFLVRLSSAISTGETSIKGSDRVHVEHILPQSPKATVLSQAGLTMEEAEPYIKKIGNLTLWSGRINSQASNKPFLDKREKYGESEIAMTKKLAEYEAWGAEQILSRSQELAELAVRVFPHPNDLKI